MSKNALPPIPTGLSPEWLTEALQRKGVLDLDTKIIAFEFKPLGEGMGMMSGLSLLIPKYNNAKNTSPKSFAIKYPTEIPSNRDVARTMNLYERETRYFTELDPRTSVNTPEVYLSEANGDNFILLMEDLSEYKVGDQHNGATLEETEIALSELVKLHAPFWNNVEGLDWIPHISNSYHAENLIDLSSMAWNGMLTNFKDYLPGHFIDQKNNILGSFQRLQERVDTPPITLTHSDYRGQNLLYGQNDSKHSPISVIDWQGAMLGKGMVDLTLFLGSSAKVEVRRKHERELLEKYVEGLSALGVKDYSLNTAWDDYRNAHMYDWIYTMTVAGTLDFSNKDAYAWGTKMLERQLAVTEDLELLSLVISDT
tara:strand:+ start:56 stop:1159 length:1104 start_codon:yes stop_codon:yes gene_type:complete